MSGLQGQGRLLSVPRFGQEESEMQEKTSKSRIQRNAGKDQQVKNPEKCRKRPASQESREMQGQNSQSMYNPANSRGKAPLTRPGR
jgi:hypothetical protein